MHIEVHIAKDIFHNHQSKQLNKINNKQQNNQNLKIKRNNIKININKTKINRNLFIKVDELNYLE